MRKKYKIIIGVAVAWCILLAVGIYVIPRGAPMGVSTATYDAAAKAVEKVDQYLDLELSDEETEEALQRLKTRTESEKLHDSKVNACLWMLCSDFVGHIKEDKIILKDRNELAKVINLPER